VLKKDLTGPALSEMDGHDVAQGCMNRHVVNDCYRSYPEHNSDHYQQCGAKTITACPKCQAAIRGFYHASGLISLSDMTHGPGYLQ
jgi:hypothetical protein